MVRIRSLGLIEPLDHAEHLPVPSSTDRPVSSGDPGGVAQARGKGLGDGGEFGPAATRGSAGNRNGVSRAVTAVPTPVSHSRVRP